MDDPDSLQANFLNQAKFDDLKKHIEDTESAYRDRMNKQIKAARSRSSCPSKDSAGNSVIPWSDNYILPDDWRYQKGHKRLQGQWKNASKRYRDKNRAEDIASGSLGQRTYLGDMTEAQKEDHKREVEREKKKRQRAKKKGLIAEKTEEQHKTELTELVERLQAAAAASST